MPGFATARLTAQPVTEADLPFLLALWSDRRVTAMTGGPRTAEQTGAAVADSVQHWQAHGFGRWIIRRDSTPVGTVKLARCQVLGRDEVELGYALTPSAWRHGYATEAATGVLSYAADVGGLAEVVAFALTANARSFAVMERLGFRFEAPLDRPAGQHQLYRKHLT
jgi:RimJ/RimL family protein N-acetyltransferase